MKPLILEEHGVFWWSDEPIPANHFAPDAAVAGFLQIEEDGRIGLELNGVLPHPKGHFAVLLENNMPLPLTKSICGRLKTSNRSVFLSTVSRNGGHFITDGITFERYFALHALIGHEVLRLENRPLKFSKFRVTLKGFEEWLRLGSIEAERSKYSMRARYRRPKKLSYSLSDSRLSFVYDLTGGPYPNMKQRCDDISFTERVYLDYSARKSQTLDEMKEQHRLLSDLFILLTGSTYDLDWPTLTRRATKSTWQFFFLRNSPNSERPKYYECWTAFPQLKESFGTIYSTFQEKRKALGPGIYLYLGIKRAERIYEEHRFVNLIWGIESLHRRKTDLRSANTGSEQPSKLRKKIDRILKLVEDPKDNEWLAFQLQHAGEPSLRERMFETLEVLPLDLERSRLQMFCKECSDRRNDISHYGGQRPDKAAGDYGSFIRDLRAKSEALSYVYHVLLLQEIGIDGGTLRRFVYDGFCSYQIKSALVDVGLLPKESIEVSPSVAGTEVESNPALKV